MKKIPNAISVAGAMKWVKYWILFDNCKPNKPKITPMIIVLRAWASPDKNVTCVTSLIVQFSFLPIEITGSQWLGITACSKLNTMLPIRI